MTAGLQPGDHAADRAIADPGKIVTDLAVALALGGDCRSRQQDGRPCAFVSLDAITQISVVATFQGTTRADGPLLCD